MILTLVLKKGLYPKLYICEIWKLYRLPFKRYYGQWKSLCGQTKRQRDGQTDRPKLYTPNLSMRGHKKINQQKTKKKEGQDGPGSSTWIFEMIIAISFVAFREEFTRISICLYSASSPHSLMPCLLTDQNFANNFWKGSPKEHFYEIISKSDKWFQRREFWRISLKSTQCKKPAPPPPPPIEPSMKIDFVYKYVVH